MATTKGICGVPGCGKFGIGRGLCATHYWRAFKGQDGPLKDEALRYALPSNRINRAMPAGGGDAESRRAGTGDAEAAQRPLRDLKKNIARARQSLKREVERDPRIDAVIAAVTMFATAMGIRRVKHGTGFLFVGADDTAIILTDDGELREATLTIGNVMRADC